MIVRLLGSTPLACIRIGGYWRSVEFLMFDVYSRKNNQRCTAQRQGVKNVFDVGPRLMLFDGIDGIEKKYITQGPGVYIIANDGRLLKRSPDGAISLVDPKLAQGGSARVCSQLIVFDNNILMDRIQWFLFKSDREVTITDPDRVKNLLYDPVNDTVEAVEEPFLWNVSQASPGSDLLL